MDARLKKRLTENGQALIEIVLTVAIASIVLTTLVTGFIVSREAFARSEKNLEASTILQKEMEAIRSVKEIGWNSFSAPGIYHVQQFGSAWVVVSGVVTESDYTRSFTVSDVCRADENSAPVNCSDPGAIVDPSTKEINVDVSWSFFGTQSISSTFYLTRYFGNQVWTQTTQSDFNFGTHTNTVATNNFGGEVELGASTGGNWANPQVIGIENLPGNQNANDIFVDGNTAYIVTSSGTGAELYIYDVSDPTNPNLLGSLDIGGAGFGIVVADGYAYIANSNNNRELTIVDVTNPSSPNLAGIFNAPTGADGTGVTVSGNTAFLVTNNNTTGPGFEFYVVDITNKSSPSQIGGLNLNAAARDVSVFGNYIYIASTHNSQELQVINVSNPVASSFADTLDLAGNTDGRSVYVDSSTVYLSNNRLNIIDASNPNNVVLISNPNFTGTQLAVYAAGNFAFLGSSEAGAQFKVIDVTNQTNPTLFGSASLGGNGLGVHVLGDYAFVISANDTAEFQIIRGGIPGNPYQTGGVFESQTFDAGAAVSFNYLSINKSEPAGTSISTQIAINTDNITWIFVGPDGTSASFYTSSGSMPIQYVSGRYFRFRVFLSGDGNDTPILSEIRVNYSP